MSNGTNVAASDLILLQSSYDLFDLFATRKLFLTMSLIAVTLEIIFCFIFLQKHYQVELAMYCSRSGVVQVSSGVRVNSGTIHHVKQMGLVHCFFSQAVQNHHPAWL